MLIFSQVQLLQAFFSPLLKSAAWVRRCANTPHPLTFFYAPTEEHEMMNMRLTRLEKEALLDVLNERMAGGAEDLEDALGLTATEADKMFERLANVQRKLKADLR